MSFPSFDEFLRNRDKYMGRDDDVLASVDKGSQNLKRYERKYIFEIEGYRCKSLEEVERIANSQGIPLRELDYQAVLLPDTGMKGDILVKFMTKDEIRRRNEK